MARDLKLRMIFEGMQKVTGPMRAIMQGSRSMGRALKESNEELARLNKIQSNITGFRTMKLQVRESAQALAATQAKVKMLAREIAETETPTKKMERAFAAATREAGRLKAAHASQVQSLQAMRETLNTAGVSTTRLTEHQRSLRTEIVRVGGEIDAQQAKLAAYAGRQQKLSSARGAMEASQGVASNMAVGGAAAMGTGIAMAAPLVAAGKAAMTFESRMIDVKKVLQDVTPAQVEALETGILNLSARVPIAADGLGQIAAEGARAGVAANELIAFTESAAKMAAAFDIEAGDAGGMMAKWRTGMTLTQPQVIQLGDKINALTNKFGGAANKVTDMVTRIGPLGKVAGTASGEIAAMSQLMISVGVESEIGATGVKNMLIALNRGSAASDTQKKAFSSLGIEATDLAKRMQVDARGGILSVLDAINKLPKDEQTAVLSNLFGSESLASIAPLLGSLDRLKENFALVGDSANFAGSMGREFDVAMSKTENQVKRSSNALEVMKTKWGDRLLPVIQWGAGLFASAATGIGNFADRFPNLSTAIMVGVASIAALMIVFGGLGIAIAGVMGPFAIFRYSLALASANLPMLGGALSMVGRAALFMGRAMLLNPIGLLVTAIAVGAYLIYRNWGGITGFFATHWNAIRNIFLGAMVIFLPFVAAIVWVGAKIFQNWDLIKAKTNSLLNYIGGIVSPFLKPFVSILSYLGGLHVRFFNFGVNMIAGLINGIISMAGSVISAVFKLAGKIGAAFAASLGIKSPSRVFMGMGGNIIQGLTLGIDGEADNPVKRMKAVSGRMTKAMAAGAAAAAVVTTPAFAGAGRGAGGASAAPPPSSIVNNYKIEIVVGDGKTGADVAREVERVMARIEADAQARQRSAFNDPEY